MAGRSPRVSASLLACYRASSTEWQGGEEGATAARPSLGAVGRRSASSSTRRPTPRWHSPPTEALDAKRAGTDLWTAFGSVCVLLPVRLEGGAFLVRRRSRGGEGRGGWGQGWLWAKCGRAGLSLRAGRQPHLQVGSPARPPAAGREKAPASRSPPDFPSCAPGTDVAAIKRRLSQTLETVRAFSRWASEHCMQIDEVWSPAGTQAAEGRRRRRDARALLGDNSLRPSRQGRSLAADRRSQRVHYTTGWWARRVRWRWPRKRPSA